MILCFVLMLSWFYISLLAASYQLDYEEELIKDFEMIYYYKYVAICSFVLMIFTRLAFLY